MWQRAESRVQQISATDSPRAQRMSEVERLQELQRSSLAQLDLQILYECDTLFAPLLLILLL